MMSCSDINKPSWCAIQERRGQEDGVSAAVDIISQYMASAAVPAHDALLRLGRPSKLAADVPAVRQATASQALDAAEASTEAANVPDAVSAAVDAASIQVLPHIGLFVLHCGSTLSLCCW